MDDFNISPNPQALAEALDLSNEILENLEMSNVPLQIIALKTSRLARLLNDDDYHKIMAYEAGGYPNDPDGASPEVWELGIKAERIFEIKNSDDEEKQKYMYPESIGELEEKLRLVDAALSSARDPNISISSANPSQYVSGGIGNQSERLAIRNSQEINARKLASRSNFIYQYVISKHYELRYSGVSTDLFSRYRLSVDSKIGNYLTKSVRKFLAVYDNLKSENPENWANAVHSCRRILEDLADLVFPPTAETRTIDVQDHKKTILLGKDQYINRIIAFVEDKSKSERFEELIGSHLYYIGNRLDSIFKASQKGTHSSVGKEEADRYVLYTYLLVGDILSLYEQNNWSIFIAN